MEVKVVSSARPLQIQRSFEGIPPVTDVGNSKQAMRNKEYYNEETHSRTKVNVQCALTPGELLKVANFFRIITFALFVLIGTLLCILAENEISLAYILALVSMMSVIIFHLLKL